MRTLVLTVFLAGALAIGCGRKDGAGGAESSRAPEGEGHRAAMDGQAPEPRHTEEHDGHGHGEHAEDGRGHGGEARAVELTPEAVRAAQIETTEAVSRPLSVALNAPARIAFTQTGVARVAPRVPGRLETIEVKLGDRVRKGAVLGYVESPELGRARADFLAAATKARVADANFRREKELLAKGITSEREMREAESASADARADLNAAEARLHTLGLSDADLAALKLDEHPSARFPARSPIDGTVVEILGTLGQSVEGTTTLFTVGDLSSLWVLLDVSESQLALVAVGQKVTVTVPALPGRTFEGRIEHIGDIVEEKTRTVHVRVAVANRERLLKPGMFASAQISANPGAAAGEAGARVVVPREAIQVLGEEKVVFVPAGANRFEAVEVHTGLEAGSEVEIAEGLSPGTKVVTRGAFVLKSELSKDAMSGSHAGHGH